VCKKKAVLKLGFCRNLSVKMKFFPKLRIKGLLLYQGPKELHLNQPLLKSYYYRFIDFHLYEDNFVTKYLYS